MSDLLLLIKQDIDARLSEQVSFNKVSLVEKSFFNDVLFPCLSKMDEMLQIREYSIDHLSAFERTLIRFGCSVSLISLKGFNQPKALDLGSVLYSLQWSFDVGFKEPLILKAGVSYCEFGRGFEVKDWSLSIGDKFAIDSLVIETDCEDKLHDFIYKFYDSLGEYDVSRKSLSNQDIQLIAETLGLSL